MSGHAAESGVDGLADLLLLVSSMQTKPKSSRSVWLFSILAASAAAATPALANGPQNLGLRRFDFPDRTGSVGLAAGWQTNATTATRGMTLLGPEGARVLLRNTFSVLMPYNPMARSSGGRALVAPPAAPVDALAVLGPQLSQMSALHGGPQMTFDSFVQRGNGRPSVPRGNAAVVTYGVTETTPTGGQQHYRALARIETGPAPTPGAWIMILTESRAPDATFDRDMPAMQAMTASLQIAPRAARGPGGGAGPEGGSAESRRNQILAKRDANDRRRQQIKQRNQINADRTADIKNRSAGYQKNNDDAVEVLRGARAIEDTRTGKRVDVNLGDSDQITDGLNRNDPDRYRQIKLRDQ
jgi:hypothetical protein